MMRTHDSRHSNSHRWTHFLQHFRIFVYVMALLVAIDLLSGTDDLWVHWVAGIWGAILAMHFVETAFFGGGLFGHAGHHRLDSTDEPAAGDAPHV